MLSLFEELFLLSMDDENGIVINSADKALGYGLAGAVLAELALLDKIRVDDSRRLELVDSSGTADEIMADVLRQIKESSRPRKFSYWINQVNGKPKKFRQRLARNLVAKGLIHQEEEHFFGVSPSPTNIHQVTPSKYEIKNRLRAGILAGGDLDLHDMALLNLARGSKLLNLIFTKDERRAAKRCVHEKFVREALGNPVAQTIEEIEQAVSVSLGDNGV